MQQLVPALQLPDDRSELVDAVKKLTQGSDWEFCPDPADTARKVAVERPHSATGQMKVAPKAKLSRAPVKWGTSHKSGPPKSLEATTRKLTAADVEKALRDSVHLPSSEVGISS